MADFKVMNVAPFINVRFKITSKFGEIRSYERHPAMDLATSGKKNLYSIVDGVVLDKGTSKSAGNWIVMKSDDNLGVMYMHMDSLSPVPVGTRISIGTYIGLEGTTGNSTGVHLDIRMQDMTGKTKWNWSKNLSDYINPATYMGIPNEKGTWCIYSNDDYNPETDDYSDTEGNRYRSKKKFKWVLFNRNRRF